MIKNIDLCPFLSLFLSLPSSAPFSLAAVSAYVLRSFMRRILHKRQSWFIKFVMIAVLQQIANLRVLKIYKICITDELKNNWYAYESVYSTSEGVRALAENSDLSERKSSDVATYGAEPNQVKPRRIIVAYQSIKRM